MPTPVKKTIRVAQGIGVLLLVIVIVGGCAALLERKATAAGQALRNSPDQALKIVQSMRGCLEVGDATARTAGEKDQLYRQCWNRAELQGKKH
jgi:hypothetical protein